MNRRADLARGSRAGARQTRARSKASLRPVPVVHPPGVGRGPGPGVVSTMSVMTERGRMPPGTLRSRAAAISAIPLSLVNRLDIRAMIGPARPPRRLPQAASARTGWACTSPQAFSAAITGSSVRPRAVRLYSTLGGTSA